jgi:hypothetical protein
MTGPELLFAAVVVIAGVPAARYNATAAGLVISYVFVQSAYAISGVVWPIHLFVFIDLAVLTIIYCKPPAYDCWPYRNMGHQLRSMWFERSIWDRIVIAAFPLCWAAYSLPLSDFSRWWALYFLSLAQFIAAGGEAFHVYRTCRPAKAAKPPDTPSSGFEFAWAGEWRGYG